MPIMGFNEYQRLLRKRGISEQQAFLHTVVFEQMIELSKDVDIATKLILGVVKQMEGFVELHAATQGHLKELMSGGEVPGVTVASEPSEN